jgi:hypothetical protein
VDDWGGGEGGETDTPNTVASNATSLLFELMWPRQTTEGWKRNATTTAATGAALLQPSSRVLLLLLPLLAKVKRVDG